MPQYYFDTSAFTKRYHVEAGSDRIASVFQRTDSNFRISHLGVMETQSAFATKVRTLQIGASQARALFDLMLADISSGVLELIEVAPAHFVAAASLVWKYGFERRMRTLDAIQMAVALDLRSRGLMDVFVVADRTLAELAVLEGLPVLDPENTL